MALDGQNFIRPGSTGRNFERPKIHYFYYPQRVYTRDPAGGPLRGGTTLTVIGEGLNGYGLMIDKINQQIIADNLVDKLREGKLWRAPNPNPGPLVLAPAQTQTLTLSLSLLPYTSPSIARSRYNRVANLPPPKSQHSSGGAVRNSLQLNVRCGFGELGHVSVLSVTFEDECRRQERI